MEQSSKRLLSITGAFEAATGLALLAVPAFLVELLLGVPPGTPAGIAVSRIAGAALLALGVACWLARDQTAGRVRGGLVAAMLLYNIAATAILLLTWIDPGLSGIAFWPAVLAHGALAVWCVACLF